MSTTVPPALDLARFQITALRAYNVASLAIILWDYLSTVHLEYRRIWKAPWGMVKALFLITRYSGIFCVAFINNQCKTYAMLEPVLCTFVVWSTEAILLIRVWALYGKKLYVLLPLCFCLAAEVGIMFAAAAYYTPVEFPESFGTLEKGCIATGKNPLTTAYWVVPLVFDAIILLLTIAKLAVNRAHSRSKIAKVFLRDGLLYFSVIFGINFYLVTSDQIKAANSTLAIAMTAIMGCRLVLSLRALDQSSGSGSSSSRDRSNSQRTPGPIVTIGGTNRRGGTSQPQTTTFGSYKMNEFSTDFVGTLADVNEEQLTRHGQGSYNTDDKDDESLYRSEQQLHRNGFGGFDPLRVQVQHTRRALSSALNYYKDINPATLTGAIDVIVVQRPSSEDKDGYELTCTPFHVRFGKLSVLRAAEKKVTLHLNDSEVPLEFSMKVGEAGEAFFVFETDTDVPEDLQTSPIISPIDVNVNDQLPDQLNDNQNEDLKGLNIKYEKINDEPEPLDLNDNVNENDNTNINEYVNDNNDNDNDDSDHENQYQLNNSNPSIIKNVGLTATKFGNAIIDGASNIGDLRGQKLKRSRPSKVSINEFEQDEDPSDKYLPKFDDAKAPSVVYTDDVVLDVEGYKQTEGVSVEKRKDDFEHQSHVINEALNNNGQVGDKTPEDLALATFGYDLLTSAHGENVSVANPSNNNNNNDINKDIDDIDDDESNKINKISNIESDENDAFNVENLKNSLESLTKNAQEQTEDEYTWDWGGFPTKSTQATPRIEKPFLNFNQFNDKNSLPNNTNNDEVDQRPKLHPGENEFEFILEMKNIKHVFELSVYGHKENEDIDQNKFENNRITFGNFIEDTNIVDNKGLICRYNDRYLDWFSSVPVMASLAIYRRSLSETLSVVGTTSHKDDNDVAITTKPTIQQPSSGWSRWWSKSKSDTDLATTAATQAEDNQKQDQQSIKSDNNNYSNDGKQKHYVKTLRLTSDQLKSLNLRKGVNNIRFSVNSSYSGVAIATARIFYWDSSDQVVISDIDGTITKSDALGHVFTMIGRDWTHIGVAKLYTDIAQNGYQILYLTSRAIGQADTTRDYLRGIRQNHYRLPDGPVIMSPDRLMASLHREVIMRKPEVFKMAALRDIQRVFDVKNPFYAGFGNRITDAMSYRSVNVPSSRIFTIDSEGEVKMELLELAGYKSSYIHMTDLVDQMFPSINNSFEPDFTDFNYWKPSIPDVELPDLSPPSPALSAKSDQSTTSRLNMFWPSSIASSLSRRGSTVTSPLSTAVNDDGKKTGSGRASRASSPSISTYSRAQSPVSDFVLSEEEEEDNETSEDDEEDNESSYADNSSIGNKSSTVGDRSRSFDYNGDEIDDDFDEDILATREMNNVPFL